MEYADAYKHQFSPSIDSYKEALRVHNLILGLYKRTKGFFRPKLHTVGGAGVVSKDGNALVEVSLLTYEANKFEPVITTNYSQDQAGKIMIKAPELTIEQIHKVLNSPKP